MNDTLFTPSWDNRHDRRHVLKAVYQAREYFKARGEKVGSDDFEHHDHFHRDVRPVVEKFWSESSGERPWQCPCTTSEMICTWVDIRKCSDFRKVLVKLGLLDPADLFGVA
jgi:hypothetical protein